MAKRKYKTNEEKKKEIAELTDMRNKEVESFFTTPDQMKEYLNFMGRFYNYSARNNVLIQMQFKGAQAVGSFKFWKDKGYSVQKDEKGIKILTPVTYKTFYREKNNGKVKTLLKYATKEEKAAIARGEIEVKDNLTYKTGHVFDVSQTDAKAEDLPSIFPNKWLDGAIDNYDDIYQSLEGLAKKMNVKIHKEPMEELGASKGQYIEYVERNPVNNQMERKKAIELNPRNSELHNIKTLVHELTHAKLHNTSSEHWKGLNHSEKEFQAEMTAFTVCSHFNIDTSDYSLNYLHNYSHSHEDIKDKMQLLDEVKDTAHEFITHLENDLISEKEMDNTVTNEKENTDARNKELQERYKDIEILTRNGQTQSIGQLTLNDFKQHFEDKHNRNILDNQAFFGLDNQSVIKAFNSIKEKGIAGMDNTIMVDHSLKEPHVAIEWSETEVDQDLKSIKEMDKHLAEKNIESLKDMGYHKTKINYIVPSENGVQVISAGRVDLGDTDYTNLHDHVSHERKELANITPKTDLSDIYSTDRMTSELSSAYNRNLELKSTKSSSDFDIEYSDAGLRDIEQFSKNVGLLNKDEIAAIKADVERNFNDRQEYREVANDVITLKGQYQRYQAYLQSESTGELTEEKVINRMNAENSYYNMKQKVLGKNNETNDVITKMESDAMHDYRYEHKDKDVKENPFGQSKSKIKKKEQGLSI